MNKGFYALSAAVVIISCMAADISADTLKERDGLRYLVSDSGDESGLYTGWAKRAGRYYYYKDGEMKKSCWITSNGKKKYFLKSDGSLAVGKVTISGREYEFDENGVLIPDPWGIELTAEDVTAKSLTIVCTQSGVIGFGELFSGSYYTIERKKYGKWEPVEYLPQEYDIGWTDEGWIINENDSVRWKTNWEWLYGELPSGKYRIGKEIIGWRKPGDFDKKMYYAYFEIE